jgi:hypothetical protein
MRAPGFRDWFGVTAWRVFFRSVRQFAASVSASATVAIDADRELPVGAGVECQLFARDDNEDTAGPCVAVRVALLLVEVEFAAGDVRSKLGWKTQHGGRRGFPPFALFGGRFIWLKVTRAW